MASTESLESENGWKITSHAFLHEGNLFIIYKKKVLLALLKTCGGEE